MAENEKLISNPITPSLPEVEGADNPMAIFNSPGVPILPPPMVIPSGLPDQLSNNKQLQGDYKTGPMPGAHPGNVKESGGTRDLAKALIDGARDQATTKDRFKYGRTYSYGAGYKALNFDRYYNHPQFKKLGFSPYRDNDAHYNENSMVG